MRTFVLLFACFTCLGHAGKSQHAQNDLAKFLLGFDPAAAFNPSSPGLHSSAGSHIRSNRMPAMQEAPAAAATEEDAGTTEDPPPKFDVKEMAGVSGPLGFFDPWGFTAGASEGKIRFYREVELKHARVAMLASLGYLVAEQFHPLFGGDIDVYSLKAFQATPLQTFWPAVVFAIAIPEVFSVFTFKEPADGAWEIKSDHVPGDLGFDPLGLKPTDPEEFKTMQTKELNNGRLAMIAIAGMIYQEVATGQKLF